MGSIFVLHTKPPRISPDKFCAGCWIYKNRQEDAEAISFLSGNVAVWDFPTCYRACIKRKEKWINE